MKLNNHLISPFYYYYCIILKKFDLHPHIKVQIKIKIKIYLVKLETRAIGSGVSQVSEKTDFITISNIYKYIK